VVSAFNSHPGKLASGGAVLVSLLLLLRLEIVGGVDHLLLMLDAEFAPETPQQSFVAQLFCILDWWLSSLAHPRCAVKPTLPPY
jgi:hypothetical protein